MKTAPNEKIRALIVLVTMTLSFLSVIGVVIVAQMLGFAPGDFHSPEKVLEPATIAAVIAILLVPVLIVLGVQKYILKSDLSSLGLKGSFAKPFMLGTLIGLGLKTVSTLIAFYMTPDAHFSLPSYGGSLVGWLPYFAWFLFTLFLNSFNEELAYRSFPISNSASKSGVKMLGIVCLTALIFSLVHFILEPPLFDKFLYRFCFGLLAGLLFLRGRSLWLIVGLHTGWNFAALSISNGDWRTGVLVHVSELHGEIVMNCLVLGIASLAIIWNGINPSRHESVSLNENILSR